MKTYTKIFQVSSTEIMLTLTLLFFTTTAFAQHNIGRVIHTSGQLTATNKDGNRMLSRGSNIVEGDTIKTDTYTRSQLRMIDGALISLRQNTQIRFEQYEYENDNSSLSQSIFSLLKGGFNTISGLIGKHNKQNYKVKTPVATIGIRGTHYGVTLCNQNDCSLNSDKQLPDGLYASVIDGEIFSENNAGYFVFSNDEYFYVASIDSPPEELVQSPGVIFGMDPGSKNALLTTLNKTTQDSSGFSLDAVVQKTVSDNQLALNDSFTPHYIASDDSGSNTYISTPFVGYGVLTSHFQGTPGALLPQSQFYIDDGSTNNQLALFGIDAESGNYRPFAMRSTNGPVFRELYMSTVDIADTGTTSIAGSNIGWGRWTDNNYVNLDNSVEQTTTGDLHYVIADTLTTPAQYGAMTGSFNYTTVGGTRATDLYGNIANSVATVNMGINFSAQTITTMDISTSVAGNTYAVDLNGVGGSGATAITTAINNGLNLGQAASCTNCNGQANLALVGPQAEGAVTSYVIGNASITNAVNGTAVLKR